MGRTILKILGAILAIWLVFMAIGWIFAMLKTFVIIGLIAVVVFIATSLLSRRSRRSWLRSGRGADTPAARRA